jgi:hypothetical protein
VPEAREAEVEQEPNSEAEADEHINIPKEILVKLKVGQLKDELKKRAQAQAGGKSSSKEAKGCACCKNTSTKRRG